MKQPAKSVLLEVNEVKDLLKNFGRSPAQKTKFFESDAEVFKLNDSQFCVVSMDTLSEEFEYGLIRDPFSMGWTTVTASVSDMAAVGLKTDALLIGLGVKRNAAAAVAEEVMNGAYAAAEHYQSFLLGGDTSTVDDWLITGAALSWVTQAPTLSRIGAKPGDKIYLSGPIGWGNALAIANFSTSSASGEDRSWVEQLDKHFRPQARCKESNLISKYASACIDTSDGFFCTFDMLADLNGVGMALQLSCELLHPTARLVSEKLKIPPWLFASAQNGEFELLFTVPAGRVHEFESAWAKDFSEGSLIAVGTVTDQVGKFEVATPTELQPKQIDFAPIRNLLSLQVPIPEYVKKLIQFGIEKQLTF